MQPPGLQPSGIGRAAENTLESRRPGLRPVLPLAAAKTRPSHSTSLSLGFLVGRIRLALNGCFVSLASWLLLMLHRPLELGEQS